LDDEGYLYVMGGREISNTTGVQRRMNDVWKSVFSYSDPAQVATQCNLILPSCGAGLKCWPNGDENFKAGLWGVSCSACPFASTLPDAVPLTTTNTTATSTNNLATVFLFIFLALFLITALLLAYTYHQLRASGVSSPIPLPASAQRWWNKNQPNTAALHQPLGDTKDTAADSLYNPLTIRDAM